MLETNGNEWNQDKYSNCAEFKKLEDTVLTQVIIDHLIIVLNKLKDLSIDNSNDIRRIFNVIYSQMYYQKKELISKYINSTFFQENDKNVSN